jgi:hypothetical protein
MENLCKNFLEIVRQKKNLDSFLGAFIGLNIEFVRPTDSEYILSKDIFVYAKVNSSFLNGLGYGVSLIFAFLGEHFSGSNTRII